jgi:hypothetical protein
MNKVKMWIGIIGIGVWFAVVTYWGVLQLLGA